MDYQTLELKDFAGGITDYPFKAPLNKYEELDNIILDPNNKPLQRPGSRPFIVDVPELPVIGTRIHNATSLEQEKLFVAQDDHIYYPNNAGTAWVDLLGIASAVPFNVTATGVRSSFAEWNGHLFATNTAFASPIKIYRDATSVPQIRTAGLPNMPATWTMAPAPGAGANSWVYYVVYTYEYFVGAVQFRDVSFSVINATTRNIVTSSSATPVVTLSAIPELVNVGGTSYDVTNIKIEIYRTVNAGQVAYLVTTLSNPVGSGTTSYVDDHTVNTDTLIQTHVTLDQSTGIRGYDPPPRAKFLHIMNGRGYYAFTQDPVTQEEFPTRVYQSIQDDIDSVPIDFFVEVRDRIRGISSFGDRVLVFGNAKVYRIDGYFDEVGRNGPIYEEISKVTGCVSQNSIVQTDVGVFFAGTSGFFFTDGYKVLKISDDFNERYKEIVSDPANTELISGTYDAVNLRVYWALPSDSGTGENDTIYVLDLRQGISQNSTFTTWTNGAYFKPTALTVFNKQLIRCDARGYVFKHDDTISNDPRIDTTKPFVEWGNAAIIWKIRSVHMDFGLPQVRKWTSRILLTFRNLSSLSVQVFSIVDDDAIERPLKEIRFRSLLTWGDPDPIWGDNSLIWNQTGLAEQWARFPANKLRCSYKQILLTNAYTIVYNSDSVGLTNIDTGTLIATLTNLIRVLTCSSITNVNVGDVVSGDTTSATGTVTQVTPYSIEISTLTGDFTGETAITNLTVTGSAVVTAVSIGAWPDDLLDFDLVIQPTGNPDDTYPITLPILQRIDSLNILFSDPDNQLANYPFPPYGFEGCKWYIKGKPKNEYMNMMSMVLYFAPLGASQHTFHNAVADSGANNP